MVRNALKPLSVFNVYCTPLIHTDVFKLTVESIAELLSLKKKLQRKRYQTKQYEKLKIFSFSSFFNHNQRLNEMLVHN